ncbi:MAG: lipase [Bacteroidetes bacterium 24-39-8]|jgi:acetyl esterase/lipase|nr:MAG: lipase [Bacteroidetes bacterium 24-39-8]HQR94708.1 alpha/beta hydrolase [Sediminibacterium sp.]HQS56255.1 alpha/beta hydrolase [Sediminibacterium sp.]
MKQILLLICITCSLTALGQAAGDTVYKPVVYPKGFEAQIDLVYTKRGDWDGKLDLYFSKTSSSPLPLVINIHGGGWNHGVKEGQGGFNSYFKAGFAVANIEYRLTGKAKAPAAIEDTRCALIYLVNNAKKFNIDPNQIIFLGGSAGGHLALMGGLLGNNPVFDANCKIEQPFKVVAIINKYGINDVGDWAYGPNITSKSATNWLGDKAKDPVFIKLVSPIHHVTKDSPPIFIVHGNADPTVPYQQSVSLHKKLVALGVKTEFITIEGGVHGKFSKEQNDGINKSIIKFLVDCKVPIISKKGEFN